MPRGLNRPLSRAMFRGGSGGLSEGSSGVSEVILADLPVAYWKGSDVDTATSGQFAGGVLATNGVINSAYASVPDSVPLSITGDIDIRVKARAKDWTPGAEHALIAKWVGASSSWIFFVSSTGLLGLYISTTGSDFPSVTSSVATGIADGATKWVRVTRVQSSGQVTFYTSDDGVAWSQLGTQPTLSAGNAIFNGTAALNVGCSSNGAERAWNGFIYSAQVRSGIGGTIAFDADFTIQPQGTVTFTESSVNAATVTVNGKVTHDYSGAGHIGFQFSGVSLQRVGASVDGAKASLFDGVNDYIQFAHHSDLAFASGQTITIEAMVRLSNLVSAGIVVQKGRTAAAAQGNWEFWVHGQKPKFLYYGGGVSHELNATSDVLTVVGKWYHIAFVYTFGTTGGVMYVDGVPIATTGVTWNGTVPSANTDAGQIGRDFVGNYFPGGLQHIAVYRTGLVEADMDERVALMKSMVSVSNVLAGPGSRAAWTFSSSPNSIGAIGTLANLQVNASGAGFIPPVSIFTSTPLDLDYGVTVAVGNSWRILDDVSGLDFGTSRYLQVPSTGVAV